MPQLAKDKSTLCVDGIGDALPARDLGRGKDTRDFFFFGFFFLCPLPFRFLPYTLKDIKSDGDGEEKENLCSIREMRSKNQAKGCEAGDLGNRNIKEIYNPFRQGLLSSRSPGDFRFLLALMHSAERMGRKNEIPKITPDPDSENGLGDSGLLLAPSTSLSIRS